MNIFKNTKLNNFILLTKNNVSNNNEKVNKKIDLIINNNNNQNYIIERINNIFEDNKNNQLGIDKDYVNIKNEKDSHNNIINYSPLNILINNKIPINKEWSQFTFKNEPIVKEDNHISSSNITEKRKNELKKFINFTNKF